MYPTIEPLHSIDAGLDCYSGIIHMTPDVCKNLERSVVSAIPASEGSHLGLQAKLADCLAIKS